jgi:hypothetical protein
MHFCQGRRLTLPFVVILKIPFRLRKTEAENPIPGIISAAGAIFPVIIVHHIRKPNPLLFLF